MSVSVTAIQNEGVVIYGALLDKRLSQRQSPDPFATSLCALGVHSSSSGTTGARTIRKPSYYSLKNH